MTLPSTEFTLSEGQRTMLDLCLGIAVEKFTEHVKLAEGEATRFRDAAVSLSDSGESFDRKCHAEAMNAAGCMDRLAAQFKTQIDEAQALRDRLGAADEITFGAVEEDEDDEDEPEVCGECGEPKADGMPCEQCEPSEPDEDAITTKDHKAFYQYGKLAFTWDADKQLVTVHRRPNQSTDAEILLAEGATVEQGIKAYRDAVQFWPDAWFISDHGNAHRISL